MADELLSEWLLAFRNTDGRYGLIDEFCAHRGVSLWFGRNEEAGLRCPYHGWRLLPKHELKSCPLVKRRPVLWAHMGPADKQPALPEWEFAMVPAAQTFASKRLQECN